jgi:hypothetical protein
MDIGLATALRLVIEASIDLGDLRDPALALAMLEPQDLCVRPVEMKGNVRYLLIEPL